MSFILYIVEILQDGDYENDWLTHLPAILRPLIWSLGRFLATILGL